METAYTKQNLKEQISNIKNRLKNKGITAKARRFLKKTLSRKSRQLETARNIRFNTRMKVREFPTENLNVSPREFYTAVRGNKERKFSRTKTRKVYKTANPYPEYLANRNKSGKTAKQKQYKEAIAKYLEKIEKAAE